MSCKIHFTKPFQRESKKLSKRYASFKDDLRNLVDSLTCNPLQGTDLGGGTRKIRMAIKSKNRGKSGGARIISHIVAQAQDGDLFLLYIYDKEDQSNVSDNAIKSILKDEGLL